MIKLDHGNVLLKPSQRKQIMSWLRRSLRLGERLGNFVLSLTFRRQGHHFEVQASVHDRAGDFAVRARGSDFWSSLRQLVKDLSHKLHDQHLQRAAIA